MCPNGRIRFEAFKSEVRGHFCGHVIPAENVFILTYIAKVVFFFVLNKLKTSSSKIDSVLFVTYAHARTFRQGANHLRAFDQ